MSFDVLRKRVRKRVRDILGYPSEELVDEYHESRDRRSRATKTLCTWIDENLTDEVDESEVCRVLETVPPSEDAAATPGAGETHA